MNSLLPTRKVIAHNDAAGSGNPMHDEDMARAMNFKGALVAGVTVYGYMTHALVQHFGEAWLETGCMQVRFRRPVYAGEELSIDCTWVRADDGEETLGIEVRNPENEVCVLGRGSLSAQSAVSKSVPRTAIAPSRDIPDPRWPPERGKLAAEGVLGTVKTLFPNDDAAAFLDPMHDDHEIYRRGITHPAWLLRQANVMFDRNFDLDAWIHTESEVQNHRLARNDEPIEVRTQVIALFDRKGHEYVDLDVALIADGDPERLLTRVMHRAIYKMSHSGK